MASAADVAGPSTAEADEPTYKGWDAIRYMPIEVVTRMMRFTAAMFLVPLGVFFGARDLLFEGYLGYENGSIPASIVAVVTVQIVLAVCVLIAYNEDDTTPSSTAASKKKK